MTTECINLKVKQAYQNTQYTNLTLDFLGSLSSNMCMNPSNYIGPTSLDSPRSNMSPNALLGTMGGGQTLGLGE